VRTEGLEPPRLGRQNLNLLRLPIPPRSREWRSIPAQESFQTPQQSFPICFEADFGHPLSSEIKSSLLLIIYR
jgi:hypothetical protein